MNEDRKSLDVVDILKNLTKQDFLHFGVHEIAYIRPVSGKNNKPEYAVHKADGALLSKLDTVDSAKLLVHQHDLHAVTLH